MIEIEEKQIEDAESLVFLTIQFRDTFSPSSISLLNYIKLTERRETCGGFLWAWKSFLSDGLRDSLGIIICNKNTGCTVGWLYAAI